MSILILVPQIIIFRYPSVKSRNLTISVRRVKFSQLIRIILLEYFVNQYFHPPPPKKSLPPLFFFIAAVMVDGGEAEEGARLGQARGNFLFFLFLLSYFLLFLFSSFFLCHSEQTSLIAHPHSCFPFLMARTTAPKTPRPLLSLTPHPPPTFEAITTLHFTSRGPPSNAPTQCPIQLPRHPDNSHSHHILILEPCLPVKDFDIPFSISFTGDVLGELNGGYQRS